ncbi:hypothetical protein WDW89_13715 [Deltaproteobacteria bacterium TL4]
MENYQELINDFSLQLSAEILSKESELRKRVLTIDGDIANLTRDLSRETIAKVLDSIVTQDVKQYREKGLGVHRTTELTYHTISGEIQLKAPYLWKKKGRKPSYS